MDKTTFGYVADVKPPLTIPEPEPDPGTDNVPAPPHPASTIRKDRIGMRCVTVHVDRTTHTKLRLLAIQQETTISEIVRTCLKNAIDSGARDSGART